jgi:HEAT repeat protein
MNAAFDGDELAAALSAPDGRRRMAALIRLARQPEVQLSERTLDALMRCLGAASKREQRHAANAVAGLAQREPRVIAAARGALASIDARRRFGAAYALGLIGDGVPDLDAADALLEALGTDDADVRWAAAELIARLHRAHPREIRARLVRLASSGRPLAHRMALYCLRDLGCSGDEIFELISIASRADDPHLRLAALSALGRLGGPGDEAATLALDRLESDSAAGVRRAAAAALGHVGNRSARVLEALNRAAAHASDESLARAARAALERLADHS